MLRGEFGDRHLQILLPERLRDTVLESVHDMAEYQGSERTLVLVRRRCYWPGMTNDVTNYCRRCERCVIAKAPLPMVRPPIGSLIASRPLQILAVDYSKLDKLNVHDEEGDDDGCSIGEWIEAHQKHLAMAFHMAARNTEAAAEAKQAHYNKTARDHPIPVGATVLKKRHHLGRHKIQVDWGTTPYIIVARPDFNVYTVQL